MEYPLAGAPPDQMEEEALLGPIVGIPFSQADDLEGYTLYGLVDLGLLPVPPS